MGVLGDGLEALRNVVLLQERLDMVRRELTELSQTAIKLDDRVNDIDKRVVRIETMIEMTQGRRREPPGIEG